MSTINYTYNVIVDRFRQFAAGHFQLRRFTHGEISQADLEKEAEWPWLHVKPRAINYSPGTRSFSFEIFISDLPRDKEDKTGYQAESITDCSLIFQDLINEIYLGNMFGSDVLLTRPVNSEPFVEQYTHTLTGVTGIVELNLDYDWSACSIPASWNYNTPTDSPSDGWGALQFIESLDQNGVFVSLLNDVEAPGNSYYYGTNASGVKGWYAIVDNIGLTCETLPDCATIISILEDIASLQTDVALKANTADLGAVAFSNDYADLDNLPTIPAAQVNSDWNATSGVAEILNKPTIPSIAGLVPESRTLTINGTTQDLSANRTFNVGTFNLPSLTSGSVLFSNGTTIAQDNANLFWDDTNNRLGIGTDSPSEQLQVQGNLRANLNLLFGTTLPSRHTNSAQYPGIFVGNSNSSIMGETGIGYKGISMMANIVRNLSIGWTCQDTTKAGWILGLNYDTPFTDNFSIYRTPATSGLASLSTLFTVKGTGNVLINTTTDAGYKLDVNGSARFGFTRATDVFIVGGAATTNTANTRFWSAGGQAPTAVGLYRSFFADIAWIPSSGSSEWYGLDLRPTINQTGTANGITRGLYIAPTLTAAADWRAIEVASGITILGASTTAKASLRIPSGTAPTSPVNGDIWFDGTDIKMRIGGVTKTFTLI